MDALDTHCRATKQRLGLPSFRPAVVPTVHCPNCRSGFSKRKALYKHRRLAHPSGNSAEAEIVAQGEKPAPNPGGKPFQCDKCSLSYKTQGWLSRHLKSKHGDSAPQTFVPADKLLMRTRGKAYPGLTCPICGKGSVRNGGWKSKTLANHMAKEHKINAKTGALADGGPVRRKQSCRVSCEAFSPPPVDEGGPSGRKPKKYPPSAVLLQDGASRGLLQRPLSGREPLDRRGLQKG